MLFISKCLKLCIELYYSIRHSHISVILLPNYYNWNLSFWFIQGIEYTSDRFEILSLRGERLDIKQCESLESILKLVQFRCLDLEATHLDDEVNDNESN